MALAASPADCDRCTPKRMCFGHKARTLSFGWGVARQSKVREFRDPEKGYRIKQTKDEVTKRGNVVTEHAVGDRQDVMLRPDGMEYTLGRKS